MAKLSHDEVRCAMLLQAKGQKVRTITRQLQVPESTLRCRLKRVRAEPIDGRSRQPSVCDPFAATIQQWMERQVLRHVDGRGEPLTELHQLLMHEGYTGSYRAVLRYARDTACRLLVEQAHYDGPGDERVMAPTPLGAWGRRIVLPRSWEHGAANQVTGRGIDPYAQLVRAMR